jgi:Fur family peroxide stress response transcriptional regulator
MIPPAELTSPEILPSKRGLRQTEQRKAVFEALMAKADHPSAVDVFMRVKTRMPSISLATVYNCLDTLAASGLVRTVNHEREPSRFCANQQDHAHLFCTNCNSVTDLPLRNPVLPSEIWDLPEGVQIADQQVSFRGLCPACSESAAPQPRPQQTTPASIQTVFQAPAQTSPDATNPATHPQA